MLVSEILFELRKEQNLTQQQLAKSLSLSQGAIGMYESGKRSPDIDKLRLFANFFGVSLNYLLGLSSDRNDPICDLNSDESRLIEVFRELPDIAKGRMLERADVLLKGSK